MKFTKIDPIVEEQVERKSSIYQHKDLLSVLIRGEWCPIIFNQVDGVECGHIKSHRYALRVKPGVDYTFPVGACRYVKSNYLLTGKDQTELKPLPEYYGHGMYEVHEHKNILTNVGKNAVGATTIKHLRVGKDYVISKKVLEPIE